MGKVTITTVNYVVEYDDEDTQGYLEDAVIEWFKKYKQWSGESIMQDDDAQIYAPELLAYLADEVFKFKIIWNGE